MFAGVGQKRFTEKEINRITRGAGMIATVSGTVPAVTTFDRGAANTVA